MNYVTFKSLKQKAVDNACWNKFIFFAYSNDQFIDGCKKVNAKKNRRGKWMLIKTPGGGFLNPKGLDSWHQFWNNWDRREEKIKKSERYIIDGLIYEYGNHEAQFGFGGAENAEKLFPEATAEQKKIAWNEFWNLCIKNDWF